MYRSIFAAAVALGLAYATVASAQGGADVRTACAADIQKACPGVQPGGGRIMACIKEHKDQVSAACKTALAQAMAERKAAGQTPAPASTTGH